MVGKEIAVKKYVVRLSAEERAQLNELISKGKRSAQLLTKAVLRRKYNPNSARPRIFDGAAEAKADRTDTLSGPLRRAHNFSCHEGIESDSLSCGSRGG